jgi:hypothetical protein
MSWGNGVERMATGRREWLVALGAGALAWTGAVRAQVPPTVRRIGLLSGFTPAVDAPSYRQFMLGLNALGWVEGKNIIVEYRYAEGRHDRLPVLAADLVRLEVDVIVTSATSDALAAQRATKAIPIVMVAAGDPVANGLVESLARPGGNVTGLSQMQQELSGKRLALLKEMVPKLSRVAVLWNPQSASATLNWKENQQLARQLGIQLHSRELRGPNGPEHVLKGTKPGDLSGRTTDRTGTGDEPEDSESARDRDPPVRPVARRPGDRVVGANDCLGEWVVIAPDGAQSHRSMDFIAQPPGTSLDPGSRHTPLPRRAWARPAG